MSATGPGRDQYGEVWDIGQWAGPHFAVVSPMAGFPPYCGGCGWHPANHPGFLLADHLSDFDANTAVGYGPGLTPPPDSVRAELDAARREYDAMWSE